MIEFKVLNMIRLKLLNKKIQNKSQVLESGRKKIRMTKRYLKNKKKIKKKKKNNT